MNIEAARAWAAKGLCVLPVKSPQEKRPAVRWKEYQARKPSTAEFISWRDLYAGGVGFVTGKISGVIVIETDGPEGENLLAQFFAEHGAMPKTLIIRSGSGRGWHTYWKHPGQHVSTRANPRIRIDIKGDGGFCVLPPSRHHSGRAYSVFEEAPIADLPEGLLEFIAKHASAQMSGASKATQVCAIPVLPTQQRLGDRASIAADAMNIHAGAAFSAADSARLQSALASIDASSYDTWRNVGFALFETGWGKEARKLWDQWAKGTTRGNFDPAMQEKFWCDFGQREFVGTKITIGTVFALAKAAGWKEPGRLVPSGKVAGLENEIAQSVATNAARTDLTAYRHTDTGNSNAFAAMYGGSVRFVAKLDTWFAWANGRWQEVTGESMLQIAGTVTEVMFAQAERLLDNDRTSLRKWALTSQSRQRLEAMVHLARGLLLGDINKFDADPMLLGCENGILDLRTGHLRDASREDFVSKSCGLNYLREAVCPNWLDFIDWLTRGDTQLASYLQRMAGYCLSGSVAEEILFMPWGDGANGKSTFLETLAAVLGEYALACDAGLLLTQREPGSASPDLVRLKGKRLAMINETNEGAVLNEGRVKFIVSNARVAARPLYGDFVEFDPTHKVVMATNHRPIVRGGDRAIWRRLHLLPFQARLTAPAEKNYRQQKLMPEQVGILAWAVQGCLAWQQMGLNAPDAVMNAGDEYKKEMDVFQQWLDERCETGAQFSSHGALLYHSFELWRQGEGLMQRSKRSISNELINRGFKLERGKAGASVFFGLRLKPTGEVR